MTRASIYILGCPPSLPRADKVNLCPKRYTIFRDIAERVPRHDIRRHEHAIDDGLECIAKLRDMRMEDVPLLVLYSTHIEDGLRSNAEKAGADYCMLKTTSLAALVDKLKPFLEIKG